MQPALPATNLSRAASLPLVGGRLCLDFANSTSGRGGPRRQEHLQLYAHLVAWSQHAGLLDDAGAGLLAAAADRDPRSAEQALAAALRLREAIHDVLLAGVRHVPPPSEALSEVNAALRQAMAKAQLRPEAGGYAWDWPLPSATPHISLHFPLWPVVRSAAELLVAPERSRIRQCPGEHCGWLFLDLTKNGSRRWCEMEVCGSRAKMQRYRRRQQAQARP